jgi:DNA-binding GntR family transcriptional regulator
MRSNTLLSDPAGNVEFLVDNVYDTIKSAILRNELKPGTALSESTLAEQLGTSRTPIREALKRLEKEDLVQIVPRRGVFVTDVSLEDIVATYQLREALECYAMQFVPKYGDQSELDRLIADFDQAAQWIEAGQIDKVNEADTRLHRFIAQSTRNRLIIKLVDQLLGHVIRLRAMTPTVSGRLARQLQEHLCIVHALKDGNVEEATEALRDHLQMVRDTHVQIRLRMQ